MSSSKIRLRSYTNVSGVEPHTFQPAESILFTPTDGRGLNTLLVTLHGYPSSHAYLALSLLCPIRVREAALITGRTDDR